MITTTTSSIPTRAAVPRAWGRMVLGFTCKDPVRSLRVKLSESLLDNPQLLSREAGAKSPQFLGWKRGLGKAVAGQ